jgi:hypothetical protein
MEETLEAFLKECGKPTVETFTTHYPHPFLFREVFVGEPTRKLTQEEIQERTRRFHRLVGRHAGYTLGQAGHSSMEALLKEAVMAGATRIEPRIVRLRRPGAAPGAVGTALVGSGAEAEVKLAGRGVAPLAFVVEPTEDKKDFAITAKGPEVFYDGERLPVGKRVRLEEGLPLKIGIELNYQTFTSVGFVRYLGFRVRMEKAAQGG